MIVEPTDVELESRTNAERILDRWQPGWRQLSEATRQGLVEEIVLARMLLQGFGGRI